MGEKAFLLNRLGDCQTRLCRAPCTQQQHGFVEIAAGLRQCKRSKLWFVERCFAHDAVYQPWQGAADFRHAFRADGPEPGAIKTFGLVNSAFAASRCNISHQRTSTWVERGSATTRWPST